MQWTDGEYQTNDIDPEFLGLVIMTWPFDFDQVEHVVVYLSTMVDAYAHQAGNVSCAQSNAKTQHATYVCGARSCTLLVAAQSHDLYKGTLHTQDGKEGRGYSDTAVLLIAGYP